MLIDGELMRAWRRSRGWDVPDMARRLRRAAGDNPLPVHDALVRMIRRWERFGLRTERYELLYASALEMEPDQLRNGPAHPGQRDESGGGGFPSLHLRIPIDSRAQAKPVPLPGKQHQRASGPGMGFAERLRALMDERGLSGRALARRVPCDPAYISRLATGKQRPSRNIARLLDGALTAGGELERLAAPRHVVARVSEGPAADGWAPGELCGWGYLEAVERRELLRLSALGLLGVSPVGASSELVRHLLERVLQTVEAYKREDWELACLDHMHAILTRPAAEARQGLLVDIMALQRQLAHASKETVPDLRRVSAWLSALHGNVLTRIGDYELARRWWATARHAADASGDAGLRVWVRGAEAAFGLYAPRPPQSVITLATTARRIAGGRVSPGLMCAMSAEAQALAALGHPEDAERILDELAGLCGQVDGAGYGWIDDSIWYVRSWVYSYLGRDEAAANAREHVITSSPSYQNVANARLHEAICVARQGANELALTRALQVVTELKPVYRSHMILHTAQRVLDAVPVDQRGQPAAKEVRATLAAAGLDA